MKRDWRFFLKENKRRRDRREEVSRLGEERKKGKRRKERKREGRGREEEGAGEGEPARASARDLSPEVPRGECFPTLSFIAFNLLVYSFSPFEP